MFTVALFIVSPQNANPSVQEHIIVQKHQLWCIYIIQIDPEYPVE